MSYTPISVDVYLAAYAGLLTGAGVGGRFISSQIPADYSHVNKVADAFAQEFDTLYAKVAPSTFQLEEISLAAEEFWTNRLPSQPQITPIIIGLVPDPSPYLPATYLADCLAIIAMMAQADAQVASAGIVPPVPTGLTDNIATVIGLTNSLKAIVPTTVVAAIIDGYSVAGDGGGGLAYYNPTYTGPANDITIIRGTNQTIGAWFRIFSGAINVLWGGAKGDGVTDNLVMFQNVLLATSRLGGSIYIPPGTFFLSSPLIIGNFAIGYDKLKIYGEGNVSIVQCKKNQPALYFQGPCNELELTNFLINGTVQVDGGDPLGGNIQQSAIQLVQVSDADIHDMTIQNTGGYAIFVWVNNTRVNIHHNSFIQTLAGVQSGGSSTNFNNGISVTDNYFLGFIPTTGAGTLGSDDQIAAFGNGNDWIVARNYIDKQGTTAPNQAKVQGRCINFVCGLGVTPMTDIIIEGNICLNCRSSSLVNDRPSISIEMAASGVISDILIKNNIIRNGNAGIYMVIVNPGTITDCNIEGNDIKNISGSVGGIQPGHAITINCVGGVGISGVNIVNNIIDTVADNRRGILLFNVTKITIANNTIKAVTGRGIEATIIFDSRIIGNQVYASGDTGIVAGFGDNLDVSDNLVQGSTGDGIFLSFGNNYTVRGNICRNNTSHGFELQSMVDLIVSGNIAFANGGQGLTTVTIFTNFMCIGNSFHNNTLFGIVLSATSGSAILIGNRLTGNGSGPISNVSVTSNQRFLENPETTSALVANNRGTAIIVGAATAIAVVFPTAEPDALYMVELGSTLSAGAVPGFPYITAKTVNGFTLNVSVPPAGVTTNTVDWLMTR